MNSTLNDISINTGSPGQRHGSSAYPTAQQVALRSIHKGIKQNDVTVILGAIHDRKLAPIRYEENDDEKEVHNNLGVLKKEYDTYRTTTLKKEREIAQFKDQLSKLKDEEEKLLLIGGSISMELVQYRRDCELSRDKFEESLMNEKSYKHMITRLKHDILCFKLKVNQLKELYDKKQQECSQANNKQQTSIQYNLQTQKLLDEMMRNIEIEHKSREKQLLQFKSQIKAKQLQEKKREERQAQQMEIAEHALNDKDADEKKWRKLLLVHRMVQTLMKNKMEKEMQKFNVVEKAFQSIKAATGITEASEVVSKYLSKEQTYGSLLSTIADSEKKIDLLKRKNENLASKLQSLKDEVQMMEMRTNKTSKVGQDADLYKSLYHMDEKAKKAEIMNEKLYQWTIRMMVKFNKIQNEKKDDQECVSDYYEQYPRTKDLELFEQFSKLISKEISIAKPEEIIQIFKELNKYNVKLETQQEDYNKRNIRVKFNKLTQRQTLKRNKSNDSNTDISMKSFSQLGNSEKDSSNHSQSLYESDSESNSVNLNNELEHLAALREELKRSRKRKANETEREKEKEKKKQEQQKLINNNSDIQDK